MQIGYRWAEILSTNCFRNHCGVPTVVVVRGGAGLSGSKVHKFHSIRLSEISDTGAYLKVSSSSASVHCDLLRNDLCKSNAGLDETFQKSLFFPFDVVIVPMPAYKLISINLLCSGVQHDV
jgi:hypothetical protein